MISWPSTVQDGESLSTELRLAIHDFLAEQNFFFPTFCPLQFLKMYFLSPGKLPSAVLSGVLAGNLVVTSIDVQNNSNRVKHHTDRFPLNLASQTNLPLVVRRGQRFRLKIKFSRPYNPEKDELKLVFKTGNFYGLMANHSASRSIILALTTWRQVTLNLFSK